MSNYVHTKFRQHKLPDGSPLPTASQRNIVADVQELTGCSQRVAKAVYRAAMYSIYVRMIAGYTIYLPGLGQLTPRFRMSRHMKLSDALSPTVLRDKFAPARYTYSFRPSRRLKADLFKSPLSKWAQKADEKNVLFTPEAKILQKIPGE